MQGILSRRHFVQAAASFVAAGLPASAISTQAFGQEASSADAFWDSIGVCMHVGNRSTPYYTNLDRALELLKDLGIRHVRDDAFLLTTTNREHEFYKRFRRVVAAGCRLDLVCADPLNGFLYVPPGRLNDIYDWCDGAVEMFEGANEPALIKNGGLNPLISADYQRALYAAVKASPRLKNVPVASPSYILGNVDIALNLADAVDLNNIHPYPGMEHPETTGPGALKGFVTKGERIFGKKPPLVSETGYHTSLQTKMSHLPVSQEIKTRYFPRLLLWSHICGVRRTYIYELMDSWNRGSEDPESSFGLADFNGNPKPAYAAVKQMRQLLVKPAGSGSGSPAGFKAGFTGDTQGLYSATFKRADGTHVLFVWLGVSGWDARSRTAKATIERPLTVTFNGQPRNVRCGRFQDDGSFAAAPFTPVSGGVQLNVSDQLVALEVG